MPIRWAPMADSPGRPPAGAVSLALADGGSPDVAISPDVVSFIHRHFWCCDLLRRSGVRNVARKASSVSPTTGMGDDALPEGGSPGRSLRVPTASDRLDHPFGLGRSSRISLNSFGPLRSRRFLACRSSSVADESPNLSICWAAMSEAFVAAFGLRRGIGRVAASPSSTRRRSASERAGLSSCLEAHA
jgi:hypothetical protein